MRAVLTREIRDRSPPITELTFLNRLRVVEGKKNKTAILIFENQNLQTLLDWRKRGNTKLNVKSGNILIYNNILLCGNETRRFQDIIERTENVTDLIQTKGAKNKCKPTNAIEASFFVWSHDSCAIRWRDVNPKDKQKFNAYIIQYVPIKSSKFLDEKLLLERDSCSSYGWQNAFVKQDVWHFNPDGLLEFNLTGLSQFTMYAFSIQTYFYGDDSENNTENDGAVSAVKWFRTLLKVPSRVKNLSTVEKNSTFITLQWSVVGTEEVAIKSFYIDVVAIPFNETILDRRNYCVNPIEKARSEPVDALWVDEHQEQDDGEFCCDKCCKQSEERKKVREQENNDFRAHLVKFGEGIPRVNNEPRAGIKKLHNFIGRFDVPQSQRNFTVEGLNPFTFYTFYVHACSSELQCSDYELHSDMTEMSTNESYDRVKLKPASFVFESRNFHVHFEEPNDKNGAIVMFVTELREIVGNSSLFLFNDCITRQQHEANGFK